MKPQMTQKDKKNRIFCREQRGIALILTIIVLTVLSASVYRLSSTLTQQRHRQQYMIDYQNGHSTIAWICMIQFLITGILLNFGIYIQTILLLEI